MRGGTCAPCDAKEERLERGERALELLRKVQEDLSESGTIHFSTIVTIDDFMAEDVEVER